MVLFSAFVNLLRHQLRQTLRCYGINSCSVTKDYYCMTSLNRNTTYAQYSRTLRSHFTACWLDLHCQAGIIYNPGLFWLDTAFSISHGALWVSVFTPQELIDQLDSSKATFCNSTKYRNKAVRKRQSRCLEIPSEGHYKLKIYLLNKAENKNIQAYTVLIKKAKVEEGKLPNDCFEKKQGEK